MSYIYKPFPLDLWVSRLYKSIGIFTPEDIDLRKIAYSLSIHLTYSDHRCYSSNDGNFRLINLNKYMDERTQREIFFHELCHIIRHEGFQYKIMPIAFRELQEWDAEHFTRYAAVPFHMLGFNDWKSPALIKEMAQMFKISEDICQYRVNHIYRNAYPKKTLLKNNKGKANEHKQSNPL